MSIEMILNDWKRFLAFLLIGIFAAFGLRSAAKGPAAANPPIEKRQDTEPEHRNHAGRDGSAAPRGAGLLVDLGNTRCPVMGGDVVDEHFIEWNHLRVGFCCPGCDGRFLKDPEKALDSTEVDWREAARAVEDYLFAEGAHKGHKLEEIRKRWKVLREPDGS